MTGVIIYIFGKNFCKIRVKNVDCVKLLTLDELGNIRQLPVWVALMLLTTLEENRATEEARYLLARSQQEVPQPENRTIIDLLTTIMVYKFEGKSQREVEEMLGIKLQETRVYREIKEEGREEGEKSLVLRWFCE
jgi:predicted transposase YdaD